MNDVELTDRVRETLRAVAATTPIDDVVVAPTPALASRHGVLRRALAAAAVVALVGAVVAVASRSGRDGAGTDVHTPATAPSADLGLPAGFDVATASPIFGADGAPGPVAEAYVRSRFPDFPAPGIDLAPPVVDGERATVAWATADDGGTIANGQLHLRRVGERWAVVAATTDGVDVSDVVHDGERVRGVVRNTTGQSVFADVLDLDLAPVPAAPRPGGQPDAAYRFGTAGGGAATSDTLALDVPVPPHDDVILRVELVGGTFLAVSEFRLEPPALPPHRDHDACVARYGSKEACRAALDGTVLAAGAFGHHSWELVASDEPTGQWVTLRGADVTGEFRVQAGGAFVPSSVDETPTLSVGPCCRMGDDVLVVAVLHPDVTGFRLRTTDGATRDATLVRGPSGEGYALVLTPPAGEGAAMEVEQGGRWRSLPLPVDLTTAGG